MFAMIRERGVRYLGCLKFGDAPFSPFSEPCRPVVRKARRSGPFLCGLLPTFSQGRLLVSRVYLLIIPIDSLPALRVAHLMPQRLSVVVK
jgi:hypothetical protein